jgi:hypothetical protein
MLPPPEFQVILPTLYAAATLLIVCFAVVSGVPFLVFLYDSYRISILCSWLPFCTFPCVSVWWSPTIIIHFSVGFLSHLSLCLCMMVTNNNSIFCCWFFCPAFPCVSVWWSPTTILYFAVGSSVPPFLVSLYNGHQQPLYILLLVPPPYLSAPLSVMSGIINHHNTCLQILFVSSLHRKHLGSQPMELMALLRRSNPPSTTLDNCLRGHNQPC